MISIKGNALRDMRREKGWTEKDLSKAAGVAYTTIRTIEAKGKDLAKVEERTLINLAKAFEKTPTELENELVSRSENSEEKKE